MLQLLILPLNLSSCSIEHWLCNSVFCTDVYRKEETRVPFVNMKNFYLLGQMRQAELAAAPHLLSSFSSPCFSVKIVYNYGLRGEYLLIYSAGIFKQSVGARNRVGILLLYRPTTGHQAIQPGAICSMESILGLLKSLKFGLITIQR